MKLFIITGISRGLGNAFLRYLYINECLIIGTSRTPPSGLKTNTDRFLFKRWDMVEPANYPRIKESFIDRSDEVVFINNAATIEPVTLIENLSLDQIKRSIAINYIAPVLFTKYIIKLTLKKNKHLQIINISSGAAQTPIAGWSLYCSTKAALKMYFKCLGKEYPQIVIHNVDPGVIDTDMQRLLRSLSKEEFPEVSRFKDMHKDGLLRSPDEVAKKIIEELNLI